MLLGFSQKNLVNVAMRMEEAFYKISLYLYNKNVLEYAQIARSGPKSMIRNIEGRSSVYVISCSWYGQQYDNVCIKFLVPPSTSSILSNFFKKENFVIFKRKPEIQL